MIESKSSKDSPVSASFLSRVTGLSLGYITRLLSGKRRNPSLETLVKLAVAMGMRTPGEALTWLEERWRTHPDG